MKQLVQNLKTGDLNLQEVPVPALLPAAVLVQNHVSLISAGTERSTVHTGKLSLLGKAKKRPDLVKQVMDNIRKEGLLSTIHKVKNKLDWPKALGYSSCGVVLEAAEGERFRPGDLVACAGQDYASHAEVVCVPRNLAVQVPAGVSPREACFTTVGAIALQGVRQADVKIGDNVCVVGLGLIGQLVAQILKANGCFVFGIDVSDYTVAKAREMGIHAAENRTSSGLSRALDSFAGPHGFDKVIITASSADNDPVLLATEILRKKGLIVIVGDVPVAVPREPHFYRKELEIKMATSYGPGRYDPLYEERGQDYPYPYVRFTENRNMDVVVQMIARGMVKVEPLITQVFDFKDALGAYDLMMTRREPYIGILLTYERAPGPLARRSVPVGSEPLKAVNVGFIGAGSFAQGYLLPALKDLNVSLDTVVTTKGISARNVAEKFGFNTASTDPDAIIASEVLNTVFIATRHNTHGLYTNACLKAGKRVFVEKPLCLTMEELKMTAALGRENPGLMVGYNRRFAPLSTWVKSHLEPQACPVMMDIRVNAGYIPADSWIQLPDIGGGRVLGEMCHFVDLMLYWAGAEPVRVMATGVTSRSGKWQPEDNLLVQLAFKNGSAGHILYTAMGSGRMPKERCEIFTAGNSFVIQDFRQGTGYIQGREETARFPGKGHREEVRAFIDAVHKGGGSPIPLEDILLVSLTTLKILKSLETRAPQDIDLHELYP